MPPNVVVVLIEHASCGCVQGKGKAPVADISQGTGGMVSRKSPRVHPQPCQTATGKARGNPRNSKRRKTLDDTSLDASEFIEDKVQRWLVCV